VSLSIRDLVEELETEIDNGGFEQFFSNSAGDHAKEIVEALNTLGARHTAGIVMAAESKFPGGIPPKDRNLRQEVLEAVSPDSDDSRNKMRHSAYWGNRNCYQ